jgi:hypothetical protein
MRSEANQRAISAVSSLGRWEYLIHASCFLVFTDIILILGKGIGIGQVDLDWLRFNLSLGAVFIVVIGYSFTKSFLLPVFDHLYALCLLPLFYKGMNSLSRNEIGVHAWLSYSLLTRNTPAYREFERVREKNRALGESSDNCRHLALLLLADLLAGDASGKSFVFNLFGFISSLQGGQRYMLSIPLLLFVLALGYNAVFLPLAVRLSISVDNEALLDDIHKSLEITEDVAEQVVVVETDGDEE